MPADVSTAAANSLAVDIRTFPWIRRLASDYAFDFQKVAPFFAGDPATPAAWADTIARSQSYQRQPAEIARVIAAQQAERGAPAAARDVGGPAGRSRHARHHHRPASRAVRRSALHPAQGHHHDEAGRAGVEGASRAGRAGVLDRRRGPRLAGSQRMYGARQRARADHGAARRPAWRRLAADRPARRSPTPSSPPSTSSTTALPDSEFKTDILTALAIGLRAGPQHGDVVRRVDGTGARTARTGGLRLVRSRCQGAGPRRLRQGADPARPHRAHCGQGRRSAGRQGVSRAGDARRRHRVGVPSQRGTRGDPHRRRQGHGRRARR